MNVGLGFLELLLEKEPNLEAFRSDSWVSRSLRPALKDQLSDKVLFVRVRDEVLHRALIFRHRFLLGEDTGDALEDLIEAERRLVWEGSEGVFVPLHQSVAEKFEDLRIVNEALSRFVGILGEVNSSKRRKKCDLSTACN